MEEQTFTFSWEVKNFSLCTHEFFQFTHKFIFPGSLNDAEFIGLIYFEIYENKEFVYFYFKRCDKAPEAIGLHATLQIITSDGTPGHHVTITQNVTNVDGLMYNKFALRKHVQDLHDDTLRIQCVLSKVNKDLTTKKVYVRTACDIQKICKELELTNFSQVRRGIVLEESIELQEGGELVAYLSVEGRPGQEVLIIEFSRLSDDRYTKPLIGNSQITVLDAQMVMSDIWMYDKHYFQSQAHVEMWYFPTFITKDSLATQKCKYLANDALNLKCEIFIYSGTITTQKVNCSFPVEVTGRRFTDNLTVDLRDLYNSKRFADVRLRVSGESVPAHKIVLQSRSKRFAEMLEVVEGTVDDVLDLPDVNITTLKYMLKYMYSDQMEDLEYSDAFVTYISAYNYRIDSLMCKCSFLLQSHLKVSNVWSVLMYADDFGDQDLKNCAVDFIKAHWDPVGFTEEWEVLWQVRPSLAKEIREQVSRTRSINHNIKLS